MLFGVIDLCRVSSITRDRSIKRVNFTLSLSYEIGARPFCRLVILSTCHFVNSYNYKDAMIDECGQYNLHMRLALPKWQVGKVRSLQNSQAP